MLKRIVKNGSQNAGNATSETQELKHFRGHAPGPLEGSAFAIGHPPFNNPRSAPAVSLANYPLDCQLHCLPPMKFGRLSEAQST